MSEQPSKAGERAGHLATLALSNTVIGVDTSQGLDDTGFELSPSECRTLVKALDAEGRR